MKVLIIMLLLTSAVHAKRHAFKEGFVPDGQCKLVNSANGAVIGVLAAGALKMAAGYAVPAAMSAFGGGAVAAGSGVAMLQSFAASSVFGPAGLAFAAVGAVVGMSMCNEGSIAPGADTHHWECNDEPEATKATQRQCIQWLKTRNSNYEEKCAWCAKESLC